MNFCSTIFCFFALLLSLLPSTRLAFAAESATSGEKKLRIGMAQEFDTLNPLLSSMSSSASVFAFVGRGLVFLDTKGVWQPLLVEALPSEKDGGIKETIENGKFYTVSTWKIRKGARWGDGTPVSARDVLFSWQLGLDPRLPVSAREKYTAIQEVVVNQKDEKIFQLKQEGRAFEAIKQDGLYILPAHLEKPVYDRFKNEKDGYLKNTLYSRNPLNPGLYYGPYLVTDLQLGSHVQLGRNPYFYGESPQLDKILIQILPSTATLESHLISGNVDMLHAIGLGFDQAIGLEKRIVKEALPYKVVYFPGPVFEHIVFNLEDEILSDKRVRQALAYGFDRESLVKSLFQSKVTPADHFISENDPWYSAQGVVRYAYSARKARALLKAAGWKLNAEGVLEKNGKSLTLTIESTSGNVTRERTQAFLQEQWKDLGVKLSILNVPAKVFFGEVLAKRKFKHLAMLAEEFEYSNLPSGLFSSVEIPAQGNVYAGTNYAAWRNPKVDELLREYKDEGSLIKRGSIAQEVARIYAEELPHLPLYFRVTPQVVPKALKNKAGYSYFSGLQVEYWRLESLAANVSTEATKTAQ